MRSLECRNTRREIDGTELGARPSERASAHLATCAACRQFRAERTKLRELVGSLEPVIAPADFDMRLRARIATERASNRQQPFFARLLRTPALAVAALFVIVAGSVVWLAQRQPSSTVTNNAAVADGNNVATTPTGTKNETLPANPVATAPNAGAEVIAEGSPNTPPRRVRGPRSTRSQDFAVLPATSIRQDDLNQAYVPSRRVEFALQDERGTMRKISLPPVSFGAQSLVDNRTAVSYSPNSRIW